MFQPPVDDFFQACGTLSPPLLEVEHPQRGEKVQRTMTLPFALIGRSEGSDLRLEDPEVSLRHAYLQVVAGRLWCVDLGSRKGTHNQTGATCSAAQLGHQGIRIGPYTIRRVDKTMPEEDNSSDPINPLTSLSDDPALLPRLALEFRGGTARQQVWLVDRPVTLIGRSPVCKVRLHSHLISRVHASLLNTPDGPWMIDLLGREGISVQGKGVRWARLEPEDIILIDQFRMRLRYLAPPTHALQSSAPFITPEGDQSTNLLPLAAQPVEPVRSVTNLSFQALSPTAVQQTNGNDALLLSLISQFSLMQQQMFDQFQQTLMLMAQTLGNLHREQMALVRQELDQIQDLTRQLHTLQLEATRPATPQPSPIPPEPSVDDKTPPPAALCPDTPPISATPRFEGDVHTWLSKRLAELQQERQSRWQKVLGMLTGK